MKKLIACLFGLLFSIPAFATLPQAAINAGYTEVEYIQSSGTQYIDTGIAPTSEGRPWSWQIKVNFSEVTQYMGSNGNIMLMYSSSKGGFLAPGASGDAILYTLNTDLVAEMQLTSGNLRTLTVNGVTSTGTGASVYNNSIYLMGFSGSSTNNLFLSKGKLYYSKIYSNGTLVQDLVPVKNSSGVYGMYNVLDNNPETAFYGNKGTGSFTGGNELDPCRNLFTTNGATQDYAISAKGIPTTNQNFFYTEILPVTAGSVYTFSGVSGSDNTAYTRRVHCYVDGVWYSQLATFGNIGTVGQSYSATFTIPTGCNGLRVSMLKLDTNSQLELGSTATPYTPYDASCHTTANACNNLFDKKNTSLTVGQYLHVDTHDVRSGTNELSVIYQLVPGKTYTLTRLATGASIKMRVGFFDTATPTVGTVATGYQVDNDFSATSITFTVPEGKPYMFATIANSTNSGRTITEQQCLDAIQIEEGSTATPYCTYRGKIKIATTKYNNAAFSGVVTALNNAVDTIKTVVANTITQATAVANLHSAKQTKPTDTCPNGKICLLVEDEAGTPHWYEIIERAPGIVPAGSGYTQVEYLQSSGTQYIDTGIVAPEGFKVDMTIVPTAVDSSKYAFIVGAHNASTPYGRNNIYVSSGNFALGAGGFGRSNLSLVVGTSYNVVANTFSGTNKITVNGVDYSISITEPSNDRSSNSLYLFYEHGYSSATTLPFTGKIYQAKIYDNNDVMLGDFVPARRNSDGVLGMYDTVSGNFFENQGSGKFYAPDQYVPSAYTRLEYIESTGTQYIDTGIQDTSKLEMRINLTEYNSNYTLVYGSQKTSSPVTRRLIIANKDHKYLGVTTGSANQTTTPLSADNTFTTNTWHNVTAIFATNPSITLDGIEYVADSTTDNASTGLKDYLFCYNYGGTPNYKIKAKVAYARVYGANGTPVREFVPVKRNSDNELGMYDCVNGVFYDNDGSGEFLAPGQSGSSLPAGYTQLQYIESTGTQEIDTGVLPSAVDDIYVRFKNTTTGAGYLIGAAGDSKYNYVGIHNAFSGYGENWGAGSQYTGFSVPADTSNIHVIKVDLTSAPKFYLDSVLKATQDAYSTITSKYTLRVNANVSGNSQRCSARYYDVKLSKNGSLVRDMVPAQHGSDVGMYDLVNDRFYKDVNGGNFTAGPVAQ